MKVLSIKQPWASLVVMGVKPIENRTWRTSYRGPLLIHAGSRADDYAAAEAILGRRLSRDLPRGGIIGCVELVDIVEHDPSPWFFGPYGWVVRRLQVGPFIATPGKLGLFDPPERARRAFCP